MLTFARTVAALYGLLLTYLLLAPSPLWIFGEWGDSVERSVDRTFADYVQHGVCYAIFLLLLLWAARLRGPITSSKLTRYAALVISHGLLTEFLQVFIPQRDFSAIDIAANITGVVAIWCMVATKARAASVSGRFLVGTGHSVFIPPPRRSHFLLCALFVSSLIVYVSIIPLQIVTLDFREGLSRFIGILTDRQGLPGRVDFSSNALIFVACSFIWMAAFFTDRRGFLKGLILTPLVFLICMAISLGSELAQVWVIGRVPSRFDVLAHLAGTLTGTALWFLAGNKIVSWLRLYSADSRRDHLIDWLLQLYLVGLIIYNLLPFDLIIHPAELFDKFERGRIQFSLFRNHHLNPEGLWELLFDVLIYIPVGVLSSSVLSRSDRPVRPLLDSLAIGGLIVVAIEFSQLFVYSRFTETTDVFTGVIGIFIGASLLQRWKAPRIQTVRSIETGKSLVPALRWFSLVLVYLAFLCTFFWSPLEPTSDHELIKSRLDGFLAIPLRGMWRNSILEAATQLIRKPLLFVPLGILLVKSVLSLELRPQARRLLLLISLTFLTMCAAGIELVQSVFPPHIPDLTDAMLYFLGGLVGMTVWLKVEQSNDRVRLIDRRSAKPTLCHSRDRRG